MRSRVMDLAGFAAGAPSEESSSVEDLSADTNTTRADASPRSLVSFETLDLARELFVAYQRAQATGHPYAWESLDAHQHQAWIEVAQHAERVTALRLYGDEATRARSVGMDPTELVPLRWPLAVDPQPLPVPVTRPVLDPATGLQAVDVMGRPLARLVLPLTMAIELGADVISGLDLKAVGTKPFLGADGKPLPSEGLRAAWRRITEVLVGFELRLIFKKAGLTPEVQAQINAALGTPTAEG